MTLRGLTWDHPRGYRPLEALGGPVVWDRQPLEGFESHPIAELAERYDLLVVDHPGIGDAVEAGALAPVDELLGSEELASWRAGTVGGSFDSYRYRDRQWALPIDAATQVCMWRPDLLDRPPGTWDEAVGLAERVGTAVPLAGPHALLAFLAICVALGAEPCGEDRVVERSVGEAALELLGALVARADGAACREDPIGVLETMSSSDRVAVCPLVYGYATYCGDPAPDRRRLAAAGAPRAEPEGRPGTVLGGTGVAVSHGAERGRPLLAYLRRLMGEEAQRGVFPRSGGQPAAVAAWEDPEVDRAWGGFYAATRESVERAWVRPRHPGYVAFQAAGSEAVRGALAGEGRPGEALERLDDLYRASRRGGTR